MTNFSTVAPAVNRDRWGRPLVIPEGGGKATAYTRTTTFIDVIEDKYNLQKWMQRQVALGIASRSDLLVAVQAHREDKGELDHICEQAREAAASSAAATTGTALHALTELIDSGKDLPALPPGAQASLEAYREATDPLTVKAMEQFVVLDTLKVAGTFDRLVTYEGETYVADLKTSQTLDFGSLKHAMQLAIYARAKTYDVATGARGYHGASTNRGILIHCPSTDDPALAKCDLWWVDIETGWEAVKVAKQVRDARSIGRKQILAEFGPPAQPSLRLEKKTEAKAADRAALEREQLIRTINATPTPDGVRALWDASWDEALVEVARARVAALNAAS